MRTTQLTADEQRIQAEFENITNKFRNSHKCFERFVETRDLWGKKLYAGEEYDDYPSYLYGHGIAYHLEKNEYDRMMWLSLTRISDGTPIAEYRPNYAQINNNKILKSCKKLKTTITSFGWTSYTIDDESANVNQFAAKKFQPKENQPAKKFKKTVTYRSANENEQYQSANENKQSENKMSINYLINLESQKDEPDENKNSWFSFFSESNVQDSQAKSDQTEIFDADFINECFTKQSSEITKQSSEINVNKYQSSNSIQSQTQMLEAPQIQTQPPIEINNNDDYLIECFNNLGEYGFNDIKNKFQV